MPKRYGYKSRRAFNVKLLAGQFESSYLSCRTFAKMPQSKDKSLHLFNNLFFEDSC